MVKLLILTIFVSLGLEAKELSIPNIKKFQEAVKKTGTPPCMTCQELEASNQSTSEIYSPFNRKNIELSILSPERAMEVFKTLKNDEDNAFNFPVEGCFARAHRMAQVMDEMDIVSGKAFLEGEFYFNDKFGSYGWSYHVASVVLVRDKKNKLVPTVFDPGLFDRPVSLDEWKKLITKDPKSKLRSEYLTKRFNYDPDNRHDDLTQYDEEQIENMKAEIKDKRRQGEMLEMLDRLPEATQKKRTGKK